MQRQCMLQTSPAWLFALDTSQLVLHLLSRSRPLQSCFDQFASIHNLMILPLTIDHRPWQRHSAMAASVDPRKSLHNRNDNATPPHGTYMRSNNNCPPVAIPDYTPEANAAALLVSKQDFDCAIAHTITSSKVLTAWVAFQMAHIDVEDSRTRLQWQVVDSIIASHIKLWDAQYRFSSELYLSQVDLAYMTTSKLNALAVFVLCRRIQDNVPGTNEHGNSLTYHTYYRTFTSRIYLAAQILTFLRHYVKPTSTFSVHRPDVISLVPKWLTTQGARVGLACQKFAEGRFDDEVNLL
jgi:hypothetical protein